MFRFYSRGKYTKNEGDFLAEQPDISLVKWCVKKMTFSILLNFLRNLGKNQWRVWKMHKETAAFSAFRQFCENRFLFYEKYVNMWLTKCRGC